MADSVPDPPDNRALLHRLRSKRGLRHSHPTEPVKQTASQPPTPQQARIAQNTLPIQFLKRLQEWFKSPGLDCDSSSMEELSQRRKELQYQYEMLLAVLEATHKELNDLNQQLDTDKP